MRGLLGVMLLLAGCGGQQQLASGGTPSRVECAPFARQVSGIALFGEAYTWWEQASGRYERGSQPPDGGVLVFRQSARLPSGHVSVVTRRVSDREISVTQANWVHHRITQADPVIDVSPDNDWSLVKVWWDPVHAMGSTIYATYGFIALADPGHAMMWWRSSARRKSLASAALPRHVMAADEDLGRSSGHDRGACP